MLCMIISILPLVAFHSAFSFEQNKFNKLSRDKVCIGEALGGSQADVLCSLNLRLSSCHNDTTRSLQWFFSSMLYRTSIKESEKYGIWIEENSGVITSILRVRSLQDKDVGFYTCSLTCNSNLKSVSNKMELCVKDSAISLVVCPQSTSTDSCAYTFSNGECDNACDSEDDLYDGRDCDPFRAESCPLNLSNCHQGFQDKICNRSCSVPQCGFDGGDCLTNIQSATKETFGVIIPSSISLSDIKILSQKISASLSTFVQLDGPPTTWQPAASGSIMITYTNPQVFSFYGESLQLLRYRLIPQSCAKDRICFLKVKNAAKYLSHLVSRSSANSSLLHVPVAAIGFHTSSDLCEIEVANLTSLPAKNNKVNAFTPQSKTTPKATAKLLGVGEIIGIALCAIAFLLIIIGVLLIIKYRKMVKSKRRSQAKQKQHAVKAYLDKIPEYKKPSQGQMSPSSSMTRSVASKDHILPRSTSRDSSYAR